MVSPASEVYWPSVPRWYLTSPDPCTLSSCSAPSNSHEDVAVTLAGDVGQHIESATVRHADADFVHLLAGRGVEIVSSTAMVDSRPRG